MFKCRHIIFPVITLLSWPVAQAQVAVQSGMTSDSHCGDGYCITALYTPSTQSVNYTLVVPQGGKPIGWWSIAQGSEMKGANYALCWVNPDNSSVTISHRGATGNDDPTTQLVPNQVFSTNDVGKSDSSVTYWSWNMPLPSGASHDGVQHIFAMNAIGPTTADVTAHLKKHTRYEQGISLDLTKPYNGSIPDGLVAQNGGYAASSATQSNTPSKKQSPLRQKLLIVHMAFMLAAWLVVVPAGILIARFGRTMFKWYPHHRNIQYVGLFFIFIGFFFSVGAVASTNGGHFDNTHEQLGLALFILVIVQSILGISSHQLRKRFGARAIGLIHIPFGLVLFGLAIWEIHLGFEKWHPVAPSYASDIVYAWSAMLAAVYAVGFYKIRRELALEREQKGYMQSESPVDSGTASPQHAPESMREV